MKRTVELVALDGQDRGREPGLEPTDDQALDQVFAALASPVRRAMLARLDAGPLLVSELAAPFDISLQAVSRHIQVLVAAGLVQQKRSGRISRCRLEAGPIFAAAVWINRYAKYWQAQFDALAGELGRIERAHATERGAAARGRRVKRQRKDMGGPQ